MNRYGYVLTASLMVILCAFGSSGNVNYWSALKGITKIVYHYHGTYEGNLSTISWGNFTERVDKLDEMPIPFLLKSIKEAKSKKTRSCKFPKSARKLKGKKINLNGWITELPSTAYILTAAVFDPDNCLEWPASDERIELDGNYSKVLGKRVLVEGILILNKHDCSRAFYILEDVKITMIE